MSLKDTFMRNNEMKLQWVQLALEQFERVSGFHFSRISAYGKHAKTVAESLTKDRSHKCDIGCNLILFDRSQDLYSILLTDYSYEGLIHDRFKIVNGVVDVSVLSAKDTEDFSPQGPRSYVDDKARKFDLRGLDDGMFCELRHLRFSEVGSVLNRIAIELSAIHDEATLMSNVEEINEVVKKIPKYQSDKKLLSIHTTIAESINDYINSDQFLDMIDCERGVMNNDAYAVRYISRNMDGDVIDILRLICLLSIKGNKAVPCLIREFCQVHGTKYVIVFRNLEKIGFKSNTISNFSTQPVIVQLLSKLTKSDFSWANEMPIKTGSATSSGTSEEVDRGMSVVYFIGGCSYLELEAIRTLKSEICVLTTCVSSGKDLLEEIIDQSFD
ncbi:hypothetical protein ACOME3_002507 [Neoechinorhynchus agilis]